MNSDQLAALWAQKVDMAGLGFEDTERALRMYFSGRLSDDIPKPKHRDGRIVEFTSKGRRRLEHVTNEDIVLALTHVRTYNERAYQLLVGRYKYNDSFEALALANLMSIESAIKLTGDSLRLIAKHVVDSEDCWVR